MPKLPVSKKRPWIPAKPKHMREVDNASFYNSRRWRSISKTYRKNHPLCVKCEREGVIKASECVDHITPISMGGSMVSTFNLQALCNSCHAKKSAREGFERRNNVKIYKK